ncbi:hypothetical protein DUNSADRAFT_973 [Dunaliella salina]|uniref:RING-type domain-containing protein n=1 Tax=Dunaliella salina TaxID=3046 RepID=A0ABQ7GXR2_DUNSA|nr:hypothetical protein DUNSADRAFT_973 [Dunaliella salina]|eukprot:KAF5839402.1 hypothetical protein DUNSADRAFT_973 [Dunaliella salina]
MVAKSFVPLRNKPLSVTSRWHSPLFVQVAEVTACVHKLPVRLYEGPEQQASTDHTSCSICCEDYSEGDAMRVLPCKHQFHIECVDRWFLTSTDYTRPPACPLCNQALPVA